MPWEVKYLAIISEILTEVTLQIESIAQEISQRDESTAHLPAIILCWNRCAVVERHLHREAR